MTRPDAGAGPACEDRDVVIDLAAFPTIEPDEHSPCGVCSDCGAGPFVILAESEPHKARCGLCRGPLVIRPEVSWRPGMPVASPPLIEPGSKAWDAIAELRRHARPVASRMHP